MEKIELIKQEIKKAVIGQDTNIEKILAVFLAKGHILLEDIPGVGKTNLALALSKALSMEHNRMQFTTDIMPSDVTGYMMYNAQEHKMEYIPGPVLCNLFLADEINRTSSKTQSALLEVMEEGQVTVDSISYKTPQPFMVIATENPIHIAGTQPLPESQMDRFMVCLSLGYLSKKDEIDLLKIKQTNNPLDTIQPIVTKEELIEMQEKVKEIYVSDEIYSYIVDLVSATRNHSDIRLGISPRGSIQLMNLAKAMAYIHDRSYVIPSDIKEIIVDVFKHRILLSSQAKGKQKTSEEIISGIIHEVKEPRIKEK